MMMVTMMFDMTCFHVAKLLCVKHITQTSENPSANESISSDMKIHKRMMSAVFFLVLQCSAESPQAHPAAGSAIHADATYGAMGADMLDEADSLLMLQTRSTEKRTETVGVEDWELDNLRLLPEKNVIFCACAKCGSTSLYRYIFQQLFDKAWPYTQEPYIQEPSVRWGRQLQGINAEYALTLLNSSRHKPFSLALMRDPRERLISAWKSKVACDADCFGTDLMDRKELVPQLMHLAEMERAECLSFPNFIATLRIIHDKNKAWELNRHFIPQHLDCFRDIPINRWSLATDVSDPAAAKELGVHLGAAKLSTFPVRHQAPKQMNQTCIEEIEQPDIADQLTALTEDEYRALRMDPKKHSDLAWLKRALT